MKYSSLKSNKGEYIKGPILIEPDIFKDERGFFLESWNKKVFRDLLDYDVDFKQDNHSSSKKGVLRGLHYQIAPHDQGKLIRCTKGKVFDVGVDIRLSSPTFSQWVAIELSDINMNQLWLPSGFAHGFMVISESADVQYKTTNYWHKDSEVSIIFNDPEINVEWPLELFNFKMPEISKKDLDGINLKEAEIKGLIFL